MRAPHRGLTLAEVAVALVLFVVGWLAILGLQQRMARTAVDASLRDEARWVLQAVADSLSSVRGGATGRRDLPWGHVEWSPSGGGVSLRAWSARDSVVAELWAWIPGGA